jgi:hypothetical protein
MTTDWLVCIDDTDNLESIGTGRLARMLAERLASDGWITDATVTRHQLLVHPDIPYTSHNSSACIAGRGDAAAGEGIFAAARAFLLANRHEGANPGLCVVPHGEVPEPLVGLSHRAQNEVLDLRDFDQRVAGFGLRVWSDGETGQGRIGAVCGAALRSEGDDGRFIDLPGIRDQGGRTTVGALLDRTGIDRVVDETGESLAPSTELDTRDWIRPDLCKGEAVLRLRRVDGGWVPVSKKSKDDG